MAEVKTRWVGNHKKVLANLDTGVRAGMLSAGMLLVSRTQRIFQIYAPKGRASGRLIRSLSVSPVQIINSVYRVRVGPTVNYGLWVHQGRRPGKMPPVDAIFQWIKEKGIVPLTVSSWEQPRNTKGRFVKGQRRLVSKRRRTKDVEKDRRSLAFLIARKIGKEGTKPFPFLTSAFKISEKEMLQIITNHVIYSIRKS